MLIGTPDFSHARITADALAAGKHVYVEKPISNNIARINTMLDAYNKYPNLVVQVGTQQRSWDHFIEAKSKMELLGPVTHVLIQHGGGYSQNKQEVAEMPPDSTGTRGRSTRLKRLFKQGYTSFRAWWEMAAALVGDRGAHHRRRELVHELRRQAAAQTTAVGFYSNPTTDPVRAASFDRLAVRQLHHVVRQRRLPATELADPKARTSKAGASTSAEATGPCR